MTKSTGIPIPSPEEFSDVIKLVANEAASYIRSLDERPVRSQGVHKLLADFDAPLPSVGSGAIQALEELIRKGVDVAVSLDGSRTVQDIQRPFPGDQGSYDVIMDNINSLREEYRKRIVGRATFTPYSTKIVTTFEFLRSLGFERIEVCESGSPP